MAQGEAPLVLLVLVLFLEVLASLEVVFLSLPAGLVFVLELA